MPKKEKKTVTIKFLVTPSEDQMLRKAVAIQTNWHLGYRNHSKYYRNLLLPWAEKVIADAAAESRRAREARVRGRIHGKKAAVK